MVPLEILRILTTIRQSLRISVTKEFNALAREMIELKFKLRSAWCQCSWTFHLLVPSSLNTFLSINKWIGFPPFSGEKQSHQASSLIWLTCSTQSPSNLLENGSQSSNFVSTDHKLDHLSRIWFFWNQTNMWSMSIDTD